MVKPSCSTFRMITAAVRVSEILGFLQYVSTIKVLKLRKWRNCCNYPKIWTMWFYSSNASKRYRQHSKQCRPWSDCSSRSSLIWVYTLCPDLSVQKLRIKEMYWKSHNHKSVAWQKQNCCASCEDSNQPGHPPSLISFFAVRMKKHWGLSYPFSAQPRLIRLGADAQADPSLRWVHSHFVGLSCWGSNHSFPMARGSKNRWWQHYKKLKFWKSKATSSLFSLFPCLMYQFSKLNKSIHGISHTVR